MKRFSVKNYIRGSKNTLEHFGFDKIDSKRYMASYPVTDNASITVYLDTESKQVEIRRVYKDHPACDSVMRDDVIPYGLNIKCKAEFGQWLDDAIGDCWYALIDMETPSDLQTCGDDEIAEIESMDNLREEWL